MSLPHQAFTINGGCNCGSVRYRVDVPAFKDRPLLPYCDEHALSETERVPTVFIDHCNDCRKATGAMLPVWLISTMADLSISINSTWFPASQLLASKSDLESEDHAPLRFYNSSPNRYRGFCEKCGTMLCYRVPDMSELGELAKFWPDMVDILLGTVDREDLEKEYFRPQRELWWEKGVPWIRELVRDGTVKVDMPRHPLTKINILVPDS